MKVVYLKSGQQAYLVDTTQSGKFVVNPIATYFDHEGNEFDSETGALQTVDAVFDKPPVSKISTELKELQDKVFEEKKKLVDAQKEYNDISWKLKQVKEDSQKADKWKIDLSQFKTSKQVAFFVEGEILPVKTKAPKYSSDTYQLEMSIYIGTGETTEWKIKCWYKGEDNYGTSKIIDDKYGFLFDITDEELHVLFEERIENWDMSKLNSLYEINRIPVKYRTDAMNERLAELQEKQRLQNIENTTKEIEKYQQRLAELTSPSTQS